MSAQYLHGMSEHSRGYLYVGTSFPTKFVYSDLLQRVHFYGSLELPTTSTRCVISNLFLLYLFQVAAEHVEHVQSVKWALESTG